MAAGRGTRLGGFAAKAFLPIAGEPMLVYSLETLCSVADVTALLLVVAADERRRAEVVLQARGEWPLPIRIVNGGAERQDSVAAGLAQVDASADLVLVHDAARPFVTPACIAACVAVAATAGAAIAAVPATDTVKVTDSDGWIVDTPDRSRMWLAQTPQVFRAGLLKQAYRRAVEAGTVATDDAALVEALGHHVRVVPGNPENRKITTPDDLRWADWFARSVDRAAVQGAANSATASKL